jgi:magnesium transporter
LAFLSEILSLPVQDEQGRRLGRVDDLVVDSSQAQVEKVLLRNGRKVTEIPWGAILGLSPESRKMVVKEGTVPQPVEGPAAGDGLCLRADLLDRQIIDINGRKVVRVNDVFLELVGGRLHLRRVEVGLAGAVRRLLAGILAPRLVRGLAAGLSERVIPWDYVGLVEPRSARIRLKVHQQLARMHPADLADIIEDLGRVERQTIVASLDLETAAQALSEIEPSVAVAVVSEIKPEVAADLLEEMQPDEAADILGDLPEARSREVLEAMEEAEAEDVRELMDFPDDSAGGLMTSDFFKAHARWTVEETLGALREVDKDLLGELDEIPVVGVENKLVGIAPLARLALADGMLPVTHVCRYEPPPVSTSAPFKELVRLFEKYHLRALPVTDEFGALVGLISIEDVFSRLAAEA